MRGALALAAMLAFSSASTIVDLAVGTPDLSTLVAALKAADLVGTLSGSGPFTVFAPTNEAFAALPAGVVDSLLLPENKATLVKLLTYHVVAAEILAKDLLHGEQIRTVELQYINATVDSRKNIMINQAKVVSADNTASNGVVHIINAVLIYPGFAPPAAKTIVDLAVGTPVLSTLVAALKAADLVGTLSGSGPFTVFAPTNAAFAALPAGVLDSLLLPENKATLVKLLTYHVAAANIHAKDILDGERIKTVEGDKVMASVSKSGSVKINQATVTSADNDASNGVVHIIDGVLTYPGFVPPAPKTKTIVDLALATPELSTLVAALKAADLVGTLSGSGPFTVFAPTNAAFAALPAGVLESLLLPENKATLVALLTYHVAAADIHAKDILDGERIKTVEGDTVMAAVSKSGVKINQANVTSADNDASNGVVHIIDGVLTYPGFSPPTVKNIVQLAESVPDLSTLVAALKAGGLTGVLSGKGPFTVFAPTNEAFAALPEGTLAHLLEPKNVKELDAILEYHVSPTLVNGKPVTTDDFLRGQVRTLATVEGDSLELARACADRKCHRAHLKINEGKSAKGFLYEAKVTSPDNAASNGVVHIIDTVLTSFTR